MIGVGQVLAVGTTPGLVAAGNSLALADGMAAAPVALSADRIVSKLEGCTRVRSAVFAGCTRVRSVVFAGCTRVRSAVFAGCTRVRSAVFAGCTRVRWEACAGSRRIRWAAGSRTCSFRTASLVDSGRRLTLASMAESWHLALAAAASRRLS